MVDIFRVSREDQDAEHSWGNNVSMVIASDSHQLTEELIEKHLIKDVNGDSIQLVHSDKTLTREHIHLKKLGTSNDITPGILLIANAGD